MVFTKILVQSLLAVSSVLCLSDINTTETELPLVETLQGMLRGCSIHTFDGNRTYAFRGIRFAEPPVGKNRFKVIIYFIKITYNLYSHLQSKLYF